MSKQKLRFFQHSSNQDYVCIFGTYLHKRILKMILFLLLLLPVMLLLYEITTTYYLSILSEEEKITYRYDDLSLQHVEGYVILVNKQREKVYEGEFANGKCNGQGIVYEKGKKRYEGKFVDNQYQDDKGIYYDKQGNLLYEGGFVQGVYEGEGFLYYPSGLFQQQGTFQHGELNGEGIEYHEDGTIQRAGRYLYGRLNGHGISYYEGTNIRRYEGEFIGNSPMGEGILFTQTGRAWYQGQVYDYSPDYESYLGASFVDVREHFLEPLQIYRNEENCAMVVAKHDVLFLSNQPYEITEANLADPTYTSDATRQEGSEEERIIIDAVALLSEPLTPQEQSMFEEQESEDGMQYEVLYDPISYMDMYVRYHLQKMAGSEALLQDMQVIDETKDVTTIAMDLHMRYVQRYLVRYHGLKQMMMVHEEQAYEIVMEDEVMKE